MRGALMRLLPVQAGMRTHLAAILNKSDTWLVDLLRSMSVNTSLLQLHDTFPTGKAIIQLSDADKDNAIVLSAGANFEITDATVSSWIQDETLSLGPGDFLLLQNEITGNEAALRLARKRGKHSCVFAR